MAKKRWQPYHWVVPLTEGEVPMDKGGFRTAGYSALEAVVYCKDCKFGHDEESTVRLQNVIRCNLHGDGFECHDPHWFCADGERQEGR
jgi:hypothetical protein